MAKKKFKFNLKIAVDAPVTVSFALISVLLFLLDTLAFKGSLSSKIFSSPTSAAGQAPFVLSNPLSYLKLVLYIFSDGSWSLLLSNLLFILLLGPAMEERYGSVVIGIMMIVSALFSGVLNACFCNVSLIGSCPLVFMMIFLNSFMSFSKKKLPLSFILIFFMYAAYEIMQKGKGQFAAMLICLAGGLCGSLFAFLTSPKARAFKRNESTSSRGLLSKAEKASYIEELDSQSPRNKKSDKKNNDDNDTVVGTLKF